MQFRKDINGIRAYAVIAVILFHFNNSFVPGGFAGVDVFFVISGFLMTKIIFDKIHSGTFSNWDFYCSRAKRIIPALSITCLFIIIFGHLFLYPSEYNETAKDSLSSLFFISNILYLTRAGYFDDSSVNNLLLHTWSLSVEWQFYIIYPLLIIGIIRLVGLKNAKYWIYAGCLLSFLLCFYGVYNFTNETYFMFPTRSWEMMTGGAVYFLQKHGKHNRYISLFGLSLIVISYFVIDKETPWPGAMAVIPVIGCALVIYANKGTTLSDSRVFQFIGTISYELYLVHWPILLICKKLNLNTSFIVYISIVLLVSFLLHLLCVISKSMKKTNIATYVVACALSLIIIHNTGYPLRVPDEFRITKEEFHNKYYGGANYPANDVFYINGSENDFKYIISGDSFGLQYVKSLDNSKLKAAGLFDHGCLIFPNYSRFLYNQEDVSCSEEYSKLKKLLDSNLDATLVLASSWDTYDGLLIKKNESNAVPKNKNEYYNIILSEIMNIIKDGGNKRKYLIIGRPVSTSIDGFGCLAGNSLLGYRLISNCISNEPSKEVEINKFLRESLRNIPNVKFIDPNDALCQKGECVIIHNNEPIYTDGKHLSIFGSEIVTKLIMSELKK